MNGKKITATVVGLGVAGALLGAVTAAAAAGSPAGPGPGRASVAASAAWMPCWGDENGPGGRGAAYGDGPAFEAAAKYLGLTEAQLRTRLQDGASLADVARAQGKSVAGLKGAIVTAVRARLQANTRLTAEQRSAMLERLSSRVDAMVTATHQPGSDMGLRLGRSDDAGRYGPGAGMHGGMGRMGR